MSKARVPSDLKRAAKRRIDAYLPSNSGEAKNKKVATFRNPGNKAGKNVHQMAKTPDNENAEGEGPAGPVGILGALMNAPSNKPKTKVQPAAARRFAGLKLAARK